MKKFGSMFGVEVGGRQIFGIEKGDPFTMNMNGGQGFSAPIEKVYAALQRWHTREHPTTSRKRNRKLFGISEEEYRVERDMISTAKWAIQKHGISLEDFVASAYRAFKRAANSDTLNSNQKLT